MNGREDMSFVFSFSITYGPSLSPSGFDQKALASPQAPDHLINPNGKINENSCKWDPT